MDMLHLSRRFINGFPPNGFHLDPVNIDNSWQLPNGAITIITGRNLQSMNQGFYGRIFSRPNVVGWASLIIPQICCCQHAKR